MPNAPYARRDGKPIYLRDIGADLLERYVNGETLEQIANSYGVTREAIRVALVGYRPTEYKAARALRKLFAQLQQELAREEHEAGRKKREYRRRWLARPADWVPKRFSNEDMLDRLRKAHARIGEPLTVNTWGRLGLEPTAQMYFRRFGSWNAACDAAGVPHGEKLRLNYKRRWDLDDFVTIMGTFLNESDRGSVAAYEAWRNAHPRRGELPSSATMRIYHTWSEIKEAAATRRGQS